MNITDWLAKIGIDGNFLASLGAAEVRTSLEKPYDKMGNTEFMEKIKELPESIQFAIRWGLYVLGATADKKLDEKSAWHKFLKDIVIDMPSEIAKRIKNGASKDVEEMTSSQDFLNLILELEKNEVLLVIGWLSELPEKERIFAVKRLADISKDKLKKILKLDKKERNLMLAVIDTKKKGEGIKEGIEKELKALARNIRGESPKGEMK